jgi:hypothetical protein
MHRAAGCARSLERWACCVDDLARVVRDKPDKLPRPMVSTRTCLHAHQAGWLFGEEGDEPSTGQLAPKNGVTGSINAVDLKVRPHVRLAVEVACPKYVGLSTGARMGRAEPQCIGGQHEESR